MSNSNYTEERLSDIEAALQCPVCYSIPRNLPISSCSSGHIICQSCRPRVTSCPTCRQRLPARAANSFVASLIHQANHVASSGTRDARQECCWETSNSMNQNVPCNGPTCNGCTIHTTDRFEERPWMLTCSRRRAEQLYLQWRFSM